MKKKIKIIIIVIIPLIILGIYLEIKKENINNNSYCYTRGSCNPDPCIPGSDGAGGFVRC